MPNPETPGPDDIDPRLVLAAQQEQAEADAAQLAHLRQRVPVLRAQLNAALTRNAQLEQELAAERALRKPQDRRPAKKTAAARRPAKKTTVKREPR